MEYRFFEGECFITFELFDRKENELIVIVTREGKTAYKVYDILTDNKGEYFEYGLYQDKIYLQELWRNTIRSTKWKS